MRLLLGAVLLAVPASAFAQNMNADEFHRRAIALQKKGSRALLAIGEIRALTKEARGAGETVRAHRIAAEKAGQTPRYCPPKGSPRMGSEEFLKRLSAIPQDERAKINMLEAMNRILAVKFPCKTV
ncbi:hypothetical protein G7076_09760 [Sphingomonas sp. HDW15A]|uniref:hypothetical protein n=1 Tax=Sphingomonas sp. HDW15A TaxID=2714942 RepID=UPI00140A59EE|nr:hypothetical protein [Sphingomonas sp. HDW15A]QIK96681.1 hypothetical protein G7076_09760 [Sphingomonas sp. HDW15A]